MLRIWEASWLETLRIAKLCARHQFRTEQNFLLNLAVVNKQLAPVRKSQYLTEQKLFLTGDEEDFLSLMRCKKDKNFLSNRI